MRIDLTSVMADDQTNAQKFYTEVLGFMTKMDTPAGEFKWLTVVSPEVPDGVQLALEPNENPAAKVFQKALFDQGIPATSFGVDSVQQEYERLSALGVKFTGEPTVADWGASATFDDTCGNLIQIHQV